MGESRRRATGGRGLGVGLGGRGLAEGEGEGEKSGLGAWAWADGSGSGSERMVGDMGWILNFWVDDGLGWRVDGVDLGCVSSRNKEIFRAEKSIAWSSSVKIREPGGDDWDLKGKGSSLRDGMGPIETQHKSVEQPARNY